LDILWDKTVKIIKDKVSQQNFDTWIRPIRIAAIEGDQVHLSVPNRFFRDWLVENYLSLIRESMKSETGVRFHVEFVIDHENNLRKRTGHREDCT
jgi:chromosomal replication initiator protein